jgi:CBS domain-containing protein
MKTATKRRVAADYMQRDVVTVSPEDTLRNALDLMTENHVTGLPVMDNYSRCIGLITASDILNYEQEHAGKSADGVTADFFDPESQQWETVPVSAFGLEEFEDVRVGDVMTRDLIWVDRDATLESVARRMLAEKVHRVLVMDVASRLYGILSAFDFVRVAAERENGD